MDDSYFAELDAQEIERIEDDPPSPIAVNEENDAPPGPDEAEEATESRKVKPKKHIVNPRPKLDDKRLKSNRGLIALEPLFEKVNLRGKGHEVQDLNKILFVLEHWAHRLFPKMNFDDALEKIEELGHKKSVSSYMTLLRMDAAETQMDIEPEIPAAPRSPSPVQDDPFDQLIGQQTRQQEPEITDEQRARMERNRLLAEERRLARMKAKYENAKANDGEQGEVSSSSQIIGQTNLSNLSHLEKDSSALSTSTPFPKDKSDLNRVVFDEKNKDTSDSLGQDTQISQSGDPKSPTTTLESGSLSQDMQRGDPKNLIATRESQGQEMESDNPIGEIVDNGSLSQNVNIGQNSDFTGPTLGNNDSQNTCDSENNVIVSEEMLRTTDSNSCNDTMIPEEFMAMDSN